MDPRWAAAAALYLAVDVFYVFASREVYATAARKVQGGRAMTPRLLPGVCAYAVIAFTWLALVVPWMQHFRGLAPAWAVGAAAGALYGLAVYGVFNFTNAAMFKDWSWAVLARDLSWGTAWAATASSLAASWLLA